MKQIKDVTIEELKKDNPAIDYDSMSEHDLDSYKQLYLDSMKLAEYAGQNMPRSTIDESVFNSTFLAYFFGSPNLTEADNAQLTTMWVQVANGTGFSPVDVIDVNGNVLFTIPAIYNTDNLRPTEDGAVGNVIAEYRVDKNRSPVAGQRLVNNMMDFIKDRTTLPNNDPWRSFKVYYGLYEGVVPPENDGSDKSKHFSIFE